MKKIATLFAALIAMPTLAGITSCSDQKKSSYSEVTQPTPTSDTIPYLVIDNYFINNNIEKVPEVIKTETEFEKCFGMASVMGQGGLPTAIDFTKQFVIVAAIPSTNISTKITPGSLREEEGTLMFTCKINEGEKQSYTTHPFAMIAVDKEYEAPVKIILERL